MDGHSDKTKHVIVLGKFKKNKRYKDQIIQEIIAAICALLNSNGGKIVVDIETDGNETPVGGSPFSQVIRMLEQSMIPIIGTQNTTSNIIFKQDLEGIVISVKKIGYLVTTDYNLYLPTNSQVVRVSSWEPLTKITNRKVVLEPVKLGCHCQIFRKDKSCEFTESQTVQFKKLEARATKRTTLADRMIGKDNKFSCYVSAFANHKGGYIYYGIRDDGVVDAEWIPNEEDKREITKKVEKAIKKMIWPDQIGQPKRGENWDIFFEPVVDEDSKPIPSTFVIVVYIAPCLGGVFTEEPECYEMVKGRIRKMSFITWMKRISPRPTNLHYVDLVSCRFKRVTWSSTRIRNVVVYADNLLVQRVNNGQSIAPVSTNLQERFPNHKVAVKLLVLSKRVMTSYRSNCFNMAKNLLEEYICLLTETTEFEFFDAIRVYLQTAIYRAKGDVTALREILPGALAKAEMIEPGIISAAIYLLVSMVETLFETEDVGKLQVEKPAIFSIRALEHLQRVTNSPEVKADMEQKSHITSALFFLGCDITGKLTKKYIDNEYLEKANSSITAVQKSTDKGKLMNSYRTIQFNIVNSVLHYRYSQVQLDEKVLLLQKAFDFSKSAESIATKFKFEEMLEWARACMALCTEGLVRTHFKPSTSRM